MSDTLRYAPIEVIQAALKGIDLTRVNNILHIWKLVPPEVINGLPRSNEGIVRVALLGMGTRGFEEILAIERVIGPCAITAIDQDESAVNITRKRFDKFRRRLPGKFRGTTDFKEERISFGSPDNPTKVHWSLEEGTFGIFTVFNIQPSIHSLEIFEAIREILVPGGILLLTTLSPNDKVFMDRDVTPFLNSADSGFNIIVHGRQIIDQNMEPLITRFSMNDSNLWVLQRI